MIRRFRAAPLALLALLVAASAAASPRAGNGPPSERELAAHVAALTAPEMEGRGSGTAGGDRAARYLADQLAALGLEPGGDAGTFFQSFAVGSTVRPAPESMLAREGGPPLALDRQWRPHGGSLAGEVAGEVVFVGYGAPGEDGAPGDYAGIDVAGKIALALDGSPPSGAAASRLDKLIAARRRGAAALLIAGDALPAADATATSVRLVSGAITRSAADALLAQEGTSLAALAARGPEPTGVRVRLRVRVAREERRAANVIAILPGRDPALASETIVIGAHYDHLGRAGGAVHPGADDNASGTAVVLGLARALAAQGGLARATVFAFFAGEEMGLLGSAHYVRHPARPLSGTVAMLNFDMVGRLSGRRLTVGGVESGATLRAVVARATSGGLDVAMRDSPFGPSDHASFYRAGVPVLFFHTGAHDEYHTPRDTAEKIDAAGMAEIARVALEIAERIGSEPRPQYVALSRPAASARSTGGSAGGAFLGVAIDPGSESDGLTLRSVVPGSAAARAGLADGDTIVRLDGRPLERFEDLRRALAECRPGDPVRILYLRDGDAATVTAVLDTRP